MAYPQKPNNTSSKARLGANMIADTFGGLLGKARDALQGIEADPKTGIKKKSKRKQILDEI